MGTSLDDKRLYIYSHISQLDEACILEIYDKVIKFAPIEPKVNKSNNNKVKKAVASKSTHSNPNNNVVITSTKSSVRKKTKSNDESQINTHKNVSKTKKSVKDAKSDDEHDECEENNKDNENNEKIDDIIIIDDDNELINNKNKLILKYVNGLLTNLGKGKINDLTEFKNIDRNDIISEANIKYLDTISEQLYKLFGRGTCRYYGKSSKSRPLNVLRGMCNDTKTYKLVGVGKEIGETINGIHVRRATMIYSIQLNT